MQIIIPSKKRAESLKERALKLFPDALVCVAEQERDDYYKVTKNLLLHPDELSGIAPIRQWINDAVDDEIVVQVDDDVYKCSSLVGFTQTQICGVKNIYRVIAQAAICAHDAGSSVFGFNQSWDVRKFRPHKPFLLNSWCGIVIGFVGRKHRYDLNLTLRADIDFCLQCLLKDRIVWIENRYSFVHKRWIGSGGNASNRSEDRHNQEIKYLCNKWGSHLSVQMSKTTLRMNPRVSR